MEATMLLCDYAEAANGKLYLMGGGWNILFSTGKPINTSIAALLAVPWDQSNRKHRLTLHLLTSDGEPVQVNNEPVAVIGEFEVGRPAGVKPGSDLNSPFVWNFGGLPLDVGEYEWRLDVDGATLARRPFQVVPHPAALQAST